MSVDTDLRSDVLGLLDADPVRPPSEGLAARARQVARALARAGGPELLPPGAAVGPYVVREVLGRGGQGTVYRAEDAAGRPVALKVPRPELVARLVREAQILFHLDHPRIVRIERADMTAEPPFIACALLPGGTLAERLRAGPLTPAAVLALADQVLEALEHGHGKGVVHRDLKPSNILFDAAGGVQVADFGVGSLRLVEDLGLPQTLVSVDASVGVGTPLYMAPEQEQPALREGGRVDGRADLFALGKVLYEALTGRPPRTVRPPSRDVEGLDPAWDAFVFRLVEDRPRDRFASAAEARAALARLSPTPDPGRARLSAARARELREAVREATRDAPAGTVVRVAVSSRPTRVALRLAEDAVEGLTRTLERLVAATPGAAGAALLDAEGAVVACAPSGGPAHAAPRPLAAAWAAAGEALVALGRLPSRAVVEGGGLRLEVTAVAPGHLLVTAVAAETAAPPPAADLARAALAAALAEAHLRAGLPAAPPAAGPPRARAGAAATTAEGALDEAERVVAAALDAHFERVEPRGAPAPRAPLLPAVLALAGALPAGGLLALDRTLRGPGADGGPLAFLGVGLLGAALGVAVVHLLRWVTTAPRAGARAWQLPLPWGRGPARGAGRR